MDIDTAISVIVTDGVPVQEAPWALAEAADAARYYARLGKWPKLVSGRAWTAIRGLPLAYLERR